MTPERVPIGSLVLAHAETFSAEGAVVARSGRRFLKVQLSEPRADLPGDTLWFTADEVERFSAASDADRTRK